MKTFEEYKREKEEKLKLKLTEATVEKKDDDSFPSLSVDEMAAVDASPVKEGSYLSFSDWKNGKDKPVQEFKEYKDAWISCSLLLNVTLTFFNEIIL